MTCARDGRGAFCFVDAHGIPSDAASKRFPRSGDGAFGSEDGEAVVAGAEGEDVLPGVAGVGGEMGVVSGLDGGVEDVDDVVVLL